MSIRVSTSAELKNILLNDLMEETYSFAVKIYNGVVERSPVREGSFRNAWKMTLHTPSKANFLRVGSVADPAPPPIARKLKLRDYGKLKHYSSKIYGKQLRPNLPKIYISNNAPYAQKLEDGSSNQAPNGVIAATLVGLKR